MKKKLAALLALAAFAGASAVAIGCEDDKTPKPPVKPAHTSHHLVWDNDGTQHWQYCDYEGCDYVGEKTDHTLAWDKDGSQHWQYCDTEGCGYVGEKTDHTLAWDKDDAQHWRYCDTEGCDYVGTKTVHEWHWDSDEAEHWQFCMNDDCGYVGEKAPHVDDKDAHGEDGKDAVCDDCGKELIAGEHEHVLVWKSNTDNQHWQVCSVLGCTQVGEKSAHVDEINNETEEETPDGLCDECGKAMIRTVTFVGNGHDVTLPAAQKVEHGKTATAPSALERDGDYEFIGWGIKVVVNYEEQIVAYSFETPITADTVLYARWSAIEGTKTKPFVLELETQKLTPLQKGEKVYYTFTADETLRYVISLANGAASQKCRFTTDLDEDDVWYGNGCDDATKIVELEKGDSVTIEFTCLNDLDEDARVSALVNEVTNEPLPDDKYLDGIYTNDAGTYQITIDREKETVTFNENTYGYRYVGGSIDLLKFTVNSGSGSGTTYSVHYVAEDEYKLSWGSLSSQSTTLSKVDETDLFEVSAFQGVYKPATNNDILSFGSSSDRTYIDVVAIDVNGNGYYDERLGSRSTRKFGYGNTYDKVSGRLTYGSYFITLNRNDDGEAVSIVISTDSGSAQKTYMRVGNAPAQIVDSVSLESGIYSGETYTITKTDYSQEWYWGEGTDKHLDFDGYDGNEFYTVSLYENSARTVYKLKVDDGVITLYNEDGAQIDTLTRPEPVVLPALNASDDAQEFETEGYVTCKDSFNRNHKLKLYEVQESGYYMFTTTEDFLSVYVGLSAEDPGSTLAYFDPINYWEAMQIEAGTVVALSFDGYGTIPESVWLTFSAVTPPATGAEDDPFIVKDEGFGLTYTANMSPSDSWTQYYYYFSFTAAEAGNYKLSFSYWDDNKWKFSNAVHFTVEGNEYGATASYNPNTGFNDLVEWKGGLTEDDPYYRFTLGAGETLIIIADLQGPMWDTAVTLTVETDIGGNYTPFTNIYGQCSNGLFADPVADGAYILNDADWSSMYSSADGLEFTSSSAFTIIIGGEEERTGTAIPLRVWELESGFEIIGGPVTMHVYYLPGKVSNPIVVNPADVDETTHTFSVPSVLWGNDGLPYVYISITAGSEALHLSVPDYTYKNSFGDDDDENADEITVKFKFTYNGVTYGYEASGTDEYGYVSDYTLSDYGATMTIPAGETRLIKISTDDWSYDQENIVIKLV